MEEIIMAIKETDSRIIVQDLDIVKSRGRCFIFFTAVIPYEMSEDDLTSLHYELIERVSALSEKNICAISLKKALAA